MFEEKLVFASGIKDWSRFLGEEPSSLYSSHFVLSELQTLFRFVALHSYPRRKPEDVRKKNISPFEIITKDAQIPGSTELR